MIGWLPAELTTVAKPMMSPAQAASLHLALDRQEIFLIKINDGVKLCRGIRTGGQKLRSQNFPLSEKARLLISSFC